MSTDPEAEAREQRRLARERLVAVAQAHRDRAAERNDPTLRGRLEELAGQVDALSAGLAAAYRAAADEEEEVAPRRHLTLIFDADKDVG